MENNDSKQSEPFLEALESEMDEEQPEEETIMSKKAQKSSFIRFFMNIFGFFRMICGSIVENSIFQYIILLLIIVNSIMMGIGTYDFVSQNVEVDDVFVEIDKYFLIIFTVELCLQFVYRGFSLFVDGWLVFDFTTIVASWLFQNFQVIRAFRVFRALRLITRIKVLKNLVMAIGNVLPSMGAIFGLLVLVLYIFAVMFTNLFQEALEEVGEPYFKTLHQSLFTLFQMLTMDWIEITREIMDVVPWAQYFIVVFVLISGFIVYNLFVAVLCDAIYTINVDKGDDEESILKDEDGPRLQREIMTLVERIEKIQLEQDKIKAYVEDIASTLLFLEEEVH